MDMDMGAEEDAGMEMPEIEGAEEAEAELEPGAEGSEAETPLLATPGEGGEEVPAKRDDKFGRTETTTKKSKGKWHRPKASDKRTVGALRRRNRGDYAKEKSRDTARSIYPGLSDLSLYEGSDSNYYDEEEKKIFKQSRDVKKLIESLEISIDEVQS